VCAYARACVCSIACWRVYTYIYTYTHTYIHTDTHTIASIYIQSCVLQANGPQCVYRLCKYESVCMCTCAHIHIFTQTYIQIHTYISNHVFCRQMDRNVCIECVHMRVCTYVHVCTYIYPHRYTYNYMNTYPIICFAGKRTAMCVSSV